MSKSGLPEQWANQAKAHAVTSKVVMTDQPDHDDIRRAAEALNAAKVPTEDRQVMSEDDPRVFNPLAVPDQVDALDEILLKFSNCVQEATDKKAKTHGDYLDAWELGKAEAKAKLSALLVEARQQGALAHAESLTVSGKQVDNFSEDTINKIETIAGYLKPLYDDLDFLKQGSTWHFIPGLIEEVDEWVSDLVKENPDDK